MEKLTQKRATLVVETAWQIVEGVAKSAGKGIPHYEAINLVRNRLAAIEAAMVHVAGEHPAVTDGGPDAA